MLRVEGEPDLARTTYGVIQNVNQDAYQSYIAKRKSIMENRNRLDRLENEVANINNTLATILQLLTERK